MKKIIITMLILFTSIFMTSCKGDISKPYDEQYHHESMVLETFLEQVNGNWGYMSSGTACEILLFQDGKISDFTYMGEMRIYEGTIQKIAELSDGAFETTISYNELDHSKAEILPEEKKTKCIFSIKDDYRTTLVVKWPDKELVYTYLGTAPDAVEKFCNSESARFNDTQRNNNEIKSDSTSTSHIPQLTTFSEILKKNIKEIVAYYNFNGPAESWRDIAASNLYLKNLNAVDCYSKISLGGPNELIGADNRGIVFSGVYGTNSSASVKDFLYGMSLSIEPAIFNVHGGKLSTCVWKLQNGYLVIFAMPVSSMNWYDRPAYGMVHVRDAHYLSFVR